MMSEGSRSLAALALAVSAVACHKDSTAVAHPGQGDAAALVLPQLFADVPDDTPYLLAGLGPAPTALYAKLRDTLGPVISRAVARERAKDPGKYGDAVLAELDGKWSQAGLASLGFSSEMHFAIYGLGLSPVVLRLEIKDEKALLATIQRVAARAGDALPAMTTKAGRRYWRSDDADGSAVIALADKQLIIAAGAPAAIDAKLGLILGTEKPARSLGDGALIKEILTRHGYGVHTIGFANTRQLLAAGMTAAGASVNPRCSAEIDRVSGRMPRVVMGYTEVSASKIDGSLVFELAPDLAAEVKAAKVALPGFADVMSRPSVLAMAAGIDLPKAQALAVAAAQAIKRLGDACGVRPVADHAGAAVTALSRALPEPFGRIAGAFFTVTHLDLAAAGKSPDAIEGVAAIVSPDARALWDQLGEMIPPIKLLGMVPDGKLHPVGAGMLPAASAISAGVGRSTIVVTAGSKLAPVGEQLLAAQRSDSAPLCSFRYDLGMALDLGLQAGAQFGAKGSDERAVLEAVGKLIGTVTETLDVSDAGVSLWSSVQLK